MDLTALFKMTYGLYVVSAEADGQKAGCIVNTATQVTAEPPRMMVAVHKDNVTTGVIAKAGAFTVTALDMTADMPYIGNFGFRTSADYDKFEKYGCETSAVGSPYSPQHACALFACNLVETVDVGTHFCLSVTWWMPSAFRVKSRLPTATTTPCSRARRHPRLRRIRDRRIRGIS